MFWDAEEADRHLTRGRCSQIACESLGKVETIMRPLRTGPQERRRSRVNREALLFFLYLHLLGTQQVLTRPPMTSPTPIAPEQRLGPDDEGMQQHAHLTWFCGRTAIPLTLFAQNTGATTADASRIDHAQAPIGFSALLLCSQRLVRWTA